MDLKSNEPFWLVKNGMPHSYPSLTENIETDILIIGAGITGSLIAHQCIKEGYKTTIIDRRDVANGSTSATTSMLQYEIDVPLYKLKTLIGNDAATASYKACLASLSKLEEITKEINSNCGFKNKESLYFASYKKDVSWLKEEYEARKKEGFDVKWLEAEAIEQKYEIKNSFGGILSKDGASIDAYTLCHELLNFNSKKGLAVYDKTAIKDTTYNANGIQVITEDHYVISAKKIIYCNGFEGTQLIKEHIANLLATYALVCEQNLEIPKKITNTLVWNTAQPYLYLRTTDDNRLLIGGEDIKFTTGKKRDQLLTYKTSRLEKKLKKILPDYSFKTDYSWAGTFAETKDGLPYIGEHSDFKNTLFVLGFGGNGITFSVLGMDIISDLLKGKKNKLAEYFRFER